MKIGSEPNGSIVSLELSERPGYQILTLPVCT